LNVRTEEFGEHGALRVTQLREFRSGVWFEMVLLSLDHYLMGFIWGAGLGVIFGVLTGMYLNIDWALAWVVRLLRPIPNLAWAPFAIIWFGVDQAAAVFIISIGVFWIVFFAAQGAIRGVDRELIELADAFGFRSGPERLVKVLLPAATPGILVGLRTALGQAWMAVVAAELAAPAIGAHNVQPGRAGVTFQGSLQTGKRHTSAFLARLALTHAAARRLPLGAVAARRHPRACAPCGRRA
jgi:ABC-type nitrate/sulfonate/bicarbonate transport system permease component